MSNEWFAFGCVAEVTIFLVWTGVAYRRFGADGARYMAKKIAPHVLGGTALIVGAWWLT